MVKLGLRIGREVPIDDLGNLHPLQQRPEHRQRAEVAALGRRLVSVPCDGHDRNISPLHRVARREGYVPRWRQTDHETRALCVRHVEDTVRRRPLFSGSRTLGGGSPPRINRFAPSGTFYVDRWITVQSKSLARGITPDTTFGAKTRPRNIRLDAKRALRFVRHRAAEWNLDPHKIGI